MDSEGLSKLAEGDRDVHAIMRVARLNGARMVLSAVTLSEVVRGDRRDANINRAIAASGEVVPVTAEIGRAAGKLLAKAGLDGRCTVDAVVVATAALQAPPIVILTSDVNDITALVAETGLPKDAIHVRHV
ncbi:PIN domain-containing protein [Kitasatospora sp. NPDC052868]|uniref:PIN domain-containing protein n=1 Tax=Kitasatospora sp. NPDC052868 TaxID=3364060 RepID=UPI0037C56B77